MLITVCCGIVDLPTSFPGLEIMGVSKVEIEEYSVEVMVEGVSVVDMEEASVLVMEVVHVAEVIVAIERAVSEDELVILESTKTLEEESKKGMLEKVAFMAEI